MPESAPPTAHQAAGPPSDTDPGACADPGVVLVADGVGGFNLCFRALERALRNRAGMPEVRLMRWGLGLGRWHSDLTDAANHETQAEAMAAQVRAWVAERPGSPAYLLGKSGGAGVVVRALERLPADSVERAILLAPAISPEYDLSRALDAVRCELVVFWSPLDVFVLGLGTRLFGTVDGRRGVSAGMVGFRRPPDLAPEQARAYEKLRQVRWHPSMARTGYLGGHVGPDSPAFLGRYIAPLLRPGV